jgi:hypothetical protein
MRTCPRPINDVGELHLARCLVLAMGCIALACPHLRRLKLPDTTVLGAIVAFFADDERTTDVEDLDEVGDAPPGMEALSSLYDGSDSRRPLLSSAASTLINMRGSSLSVQGYGGLIPLLSRLFPTLTQLKVHDLQRLLMARGEISKDVAFFTHGMTK